MTLSVSAMCTLSWSFAQDLALWDDLGIDHVGLLGMKLQPDAVAQLRARSWSTTTVIAGTFDLAAPATWDTTRAAIAGAIEVAEALGGCVYVTTGRTDGRTWDEVAATFGEAVAPSVALAGSRGVRLAVEPSLRTDISFVHTIRDVIDLADRTGVSIVADIGNCWMERDVEATVRRAGDRIAAVQLCDVVIGREGRVMPGDGELPIHRFIESALDAGWKGPFELEVVGPALEAEGYEPALRRGVGQTRSILEEVLG